MSEDDAVKVQCTMVPKMSEMEIERIESDPENMRMVIYYKAPIVFVDLQIKFKNDDN